MPSKNAKVTNTTSSVDEHNTTTTAHAAHVTEGNAGVQQLSHPVSPAPCVDEAPNMPNKKAKRNDKAPDTVTTPAPPPANLTVGNVGVHEPTPHPELTAAESPTVTEPPTVTGPVPESAYWDLDQHYDQLYDHFKVPNLEANLGFDLSPQEMMSSKYPFVKMDPVRIQMGSDCKMFSAPFGVVISKENKPRLSINIPRNSKEVELIKHIEGAIQQVFNTRREQWQLSSELQFLSVLKDHDQSEDTVLLNTKLNQLEKKNTYYRFSPKLPNGHLKATVVPFNAFTDLLVAGSKCMLAVEANGIWTNQTQYGLYLKANMVGFTPGPSKAFRHLQFSCNIDFNN